MDQKKINLLLIIAAAFFAVLAIILFVFGIIYDRGALVKALLIVASVLVLALAAELAYLFLLSRNVVPNYFLFNPSLNANIPAEKLTFEMIDMRMNKYLSGFAKNEAKLWVDGVLEARAADINPKFKPIVAYKLLFDIAENDSETAWKCFLLASDMTVQYIAEGLAENNDNDMAASILQLKSTKPVNMQQTREFLVSNKKYIKKQLFEYVTNNIEKF